ncbi:hypothetical protein [Limnoglobus roseus]|uniref:Uncharacterized protein n=1 Tax=Limnoglobus roseus TaxID=2598579 RepID=A0A5C1AHU9_9BACT|nr:hypothetical protein [Limnoglobus roseus]QEL18410.1 hypothetical protein PX52LOC_05434 [Limnoglobus roseus]
MPDDLKTAMGKVASSGGNKLFYFAFAEGKRKKGAEKGELVIGTSKPTKADVAAALVECKDFVEGICWAGFLPQDKDSVFVIADGKTISMKALGVMQAVVRAAADRYALFRHPYPAERTRANKFSDGKVAAPEPPKPPSVPPPVDKSDAVRAEIEAAAAPAAVGAAPTVPDRMSALLRRAGNSKPVPDWQDRLEAARKLVQGGRVEDAVPLVDRLEKELNAYHAERTKAQQGMTFEASQAQGKYAELLKQWGAELNAADELGNDDGTRAKARLGESMAAAKANDFRKAVPLIQQAVRFLAIAKEQG